MTLTEQEIQEAISKIDDLVSQDIYTDSVKNDLIDTLSIRTLPIERVKQIYEVYFNSDEVKKQEFPSFIKEVDGQVAMNLSQRTSVYERDIERSETMIELLEMLSKSEDMGTRWAVAKNPHTPVSILETLAKDEINLVRALVATNPNTPKSLLSDFFSDEKIVRDGLSGNPNTPVKYLEVLSDDKDKMVRLRVAENPATSKAILEKLLKDSDQNVAKASEVMLREK
jgi:hypothetical protein